MSFSDSDDLTPLEVLLTTAGARFSSWGSMAAVIPAPEDGQVVYIADDLAYYIRISGDWLPLYSAPRSYTPSFVNLTIGNGTVDAGWSMSGGVVHWWCRITLGSTSNVAGLITVILPRPAARATATPGGAVLVGRVFCRKVTGSGGTSRRVFDVTTDYTIDPLRAWGLSQVDGIGPTASNPWTWVAGDTLDFVGSYRAATS